MPHTPSAWKRLRQTEKRKKRNRTWAKVLKKEVREVNDALKANDAATAATELVSATKKLDSAADKGIIHKNKAARLKSRMAKKINKAKAAAAAPKA
jgi:small subunit ribosomal protein S20